MLSSLSSTDIINFLTLSVLEIVLGIDNVIFIAILVQPLAVELRNKVRCYGLGLALVLRCGLLFVANHIIHLTDPLFSVYGIAISYKSLLLLVGGLFLILKPIFELVEMFGEHHSEVKVEKKSTKNIVLQIIFIDLVLSFDSIMTAVGISPDNLAIIIAAVVLSMVIMILFAKPVGDFIYQYPHIKIVALAFIAFVGVFLVIEGLNFSFPKGYLYTALAFSMITETINILLSKKKHIK
jgi:predicted tellurium resistance membrane protein TerC